MSFALRSLPVFASLVATLAMAPVSPEAGNVVFFIAGAVSLFFLAETGKYEMRRPLAVMTVAGLILLGLAYTIGAGSLEGLLGLLYFAPLLAILPLLAAAHDLEGVDSFGVIGILALCGVAGATVLAVGDLMATGTGRAGGSVANPIHFADVVLLAGFIATAGAISRAGRWRLVFLLVPFLAIVPVVLSGTRGAVVAAIAMLAVASLMAAALRILPIRLVALVSAAVILAGAAAILSGADQLSGIDRVFKDIADVVSVGMPTDDSTSIRLQMYIGGFRAFFEAPLFGYGPLAFVEVAKNLADVPFENAPHLHNDILDFAASGGIVGLIAYCLFILAPIVEVARAPASWAKRRILVFTCTLMTGFFVMGLTNAMFGILTVTVYYAVICIVIGILVRQASAEVEP